MFERNCRRSRQLSLPLLSLHRKWGRGFQNETPQRRCKQCSSERYSDCARYSQTPCSETSAPPDLPPDRHSHLLGGGRAERCRARVPSGMQHFPDVFVEPPPVGSISIGRATMRRDEPLARPI